MNPENMQDPSAGGDLNEDLVRNVLASLGYSHVNEDDLADIIQQTAAQIHPAGGSSSSSPADHHAQQQQETFQQEQVMQQQPVAATATPPADDGDDGSSSITDDFQQQQPPGVSGRTTSAAPQHQQQPVPQNMSPFAHGRHGAPIDEVTDEAEYDEEVELTGGPDVIYRQQPRTARPQSAGAQRHVDQYLQQVASQHQHQHHQQLHHPHGEENSSHNGLTPRGVNMMNLSDGHVSNATGHVAGGEKQGRVYRSEKEYRHQQRFKKFVDMERRARSSQSPENNMPGGGMPYSGAAQGKDAAYTRAHQHLPANPQQHVPQSVYAPQDTSHDDLFRPPTHRHETVHEKESVRMKQRMGVQQHHAPMFHNRVASNVIYAHTDDKTYLPRRGNNASKLQMATPRRHVDVVARGQQMRQAWKSDNFLAQKGRKDERWFVRQSMLGGGMY